MYFGLERKEILSKDKLENMMEKADLIVTCDPLSTTIFDISLNKFSAKLLVDFLKLLFITISGFFGNSGFIAIPTISPNFFLPIVWVIFSPRYDVGLRYIY